MTTAPFDLENPTEEHMYFIIAGKTGSARDDRPMHSIAARKTRQYGLT